MIKAQWNTQALKVRHRYLLYVFIPVLSLAMHFHIFTRDLVGYHVWRQTETQNNIENFAHGDFNILHPAINNAGNGSGICRLEFPIMQWLFACFYKIFGDHIIISRVLSFIIGLFTVWGMYHLTCALFKRNMVSMIAAWCFSFSPLFYYYTMNPLPDNLALCLGVWGICFFFRWINEKRTALLLWSAAFLGTAAMVKLPFAVYLAAAGAYAAIAVWRRQPEMKKLWHLFVAFGLCFMPAAAWYIFVIPAWQTDGGGVVHGILSASKSDIPNLLYLLQGNIISTLPELLINYGALLFFISGIIWMLKGGAYRNRLFPVLAGWGIGVLFYFIFELNIIGTVHDYYLYPFLPPIILITAYGAEKLLTMPLYIIRTLSVIALAVLPLTAFLRVNHRWNTVDPGFNPDLLKYHMVLAAAAPGKALCVAGNDESGNIWFYYIRKKGWNFSSDSLSGAALQGMIEQGAAYLYTDAPKVYQSAGIKPYLSRLVLQAGSIRVYALSEPAGKAGTR